MNEENRAYSYAVKLLTGRDYSEVKLREKLVQKKYSQETIEKVVAELHTRKFIREESYLEARIKAFMNKGYSQKYILQKLTMESDSINMALIEEVFLENQITEEDQVRKLIQKKCPKEFSANYAEKQKQTQKVFRYAFSKGHSPENIFKKLKLTSEDSI